MSLKIHLDKKSDAYLSQMATEANMGKAELAKIAVYNIIALWMVDREKAKNDLVIAGLAHDGDFVSE